MKRFKKILFFYNFGTCQDAALQRAFVLAAQNNATLTLMSVIKAPPPISQSDVVTRELKHIEAEILQEHQTVLGKLAERHQAQQVPVHLKVVTGITFVEVIREVLVNHHDLVTMAADRNYGILNRLFGSTSMHLMRKCPCPVWVIKPGGNPYKRVLAAVDVTVDPWDQPEQAINSLILQLAGSMASADSAELHVVQVWSVYQEGYLQARGNMDDQAIRRLRRDTKQDYAAKLGALMEKNRQYIDQRVHIHLKRGEAPAKIITRLAKSEKIDLMVMGTVCRTGVSGFFIGNTAEEVLSAANCSVLTVKPEGFVSPVTLEDQ